MKEMNIPGVSHRRLLRELREIDRAGSSAGISFRDFSIWWNRHKEVQRQRVRRDVKELFDMVDVDSSGLLEKPEMEDFLNRARRVKAIRKIVDDPSAPFDLEQDWRWMRTGAPPGLEG